MKNAKQEFLDLIYQANLREGNLCCAAIRFDDREFFLPEYFTKIDYAVFLSQLDDLYNDDFGHQYLYGIIWFTNNIWAVRGEYDGSEWWDLMFYPEINLKSVKT